MNTVKDRERLETIAQMISDLERRLVNFTYEWFVDDDDERDLTAYRLSVVGENANKLSEAIKARHPALPWWGMSALRNVVSHEYRPWLPASYGMRYRTLVRLRKCAYRKRSHNLDRDHL